jgi:hypothetical protein
MMKFVEVSSYKFQEIKTKAEFVDVLMDLLEI